MMNETYGLPGKSITRTKPTVINVIIADHQPVFRAGIAKLLATEDDMRILAQPYSAEHLFNAVDKLRPHVLILSTGFIPSEDDLRRLTGTAGERQIAILMLTENDQRTPHLVPFGVQGVFYRSVKGEMLIEGVRRLAQGGRYLQMHAAAEISADLVGERVTSQLSRRELKVVAAVVQGYRNSEIAKTLGVTVPMIKKLTRSIFDKTGVSGRLELALFVIHHQVLAHAAAEQAMQPGIPAHLRTTSIDRMYTSKNLAVLPKIVIDLPHPPKTA
jgi:DNA-binding NarL/FixJ family response regulator